MALDKALIELEKYAKELASVENVKQAIKTDEFWYGKWGNVYKYYKYIVKNSDDLEEIKQAQSIVNNISVINPSMQYCVSEIINFDAIKRENQSNNNGSFNYKKIADEVDSLIDELNAMSYRGYDTDKIRDIESYLEEYGDIIIQNKDSIPSTAYRDLISDIENALNYCDELNNTFSDIEDSINRL